MRGKDTQRQNRELLSTGVTAFREDVLRMIWHLHSILKADLTKSLTYSTWIALTISSHLHLCCSTPGIVALGFWDYQASNRVGNTWILTSLISSN